MTETRAQEVRRIVTEGFASFERPDMTDVLSAKLDEVLAEMSPGWAGAMVAAFALQVRHAEDDDWAEKADLETAKKFADALPALRKALSLPITAEPGEVVSDCAGEGHDHPNHDWRTACLKCGVFRGSDLSTLTGKE